MLDYGYGRGYDKVDEPGEEPDTCSTPAPACTTLSDGGVSYLQYRTGNRFSFTYDQNIF